MRKPVSFSSIPFDSLAAIGISLSCFGLAIFSFPLCSVCNDSDFFLSGPLDIRGKRATPSPADGDLMARHVDRALLTFPFSCNQLITRSILLLSPSRMNSFWTICSSKFVHGTTLSRCTIGLAMSLKRNGLSVNPFDLIWKFCPYQRHPPRLNCGSIIWLIFAPMHTGNPRISQPLRLTSISIGLV